MSWVKFYGFTLNGHRYADGVGLNCGCPQRYVPLISSYVSSVTMWRVLFKENNGNTKITLGIWSKLTVKTSERRHWRLSGLFIIYFECNLLTVLIVKFWKLNTGLRMMGSLRESLSSSHFIPMLYFSTPWKRQKTCFQEV